MAKKQWQAERSTSLAQAKERAEQEGLSIEDLRFMSAGWDHDVFSATVDKQKCTLRFCRREVAQTPLRTEHKLIHFVSKELEDKLELSFPTPLTLFDDSESDLWPFALRAFVPGQTLCRKFASDEERRQLLPSVSKFLKHLHTIDASAAKDAGAPFDEYRRTKIERVAPIIRDRLDEFRQSGLVDQTLFERVDALLQRVQDHDGDHVLCHGDLYARHLLVNDELHLRGVIDFGDVHLGDRAKDLAILYHLSPSDPFAFYDLGEVEKTRALMMAVHSACMLVAYGKDIEDKALTFEGERFLARLPALLAVEFH